LAVAGLVYEGVRWVDNQWMKEGTLSPWAGVAYSHSLGTSYPCSDSSTTTCSLAEAFADFAAINGYPTALNWQEVRLVSATPHSGTCGPEVFIDCAVKVVYDRGYRNSPGGTLYWALGVQTTF